jgi:hypothetical protein
VGGAEPGVDRRGHRLTRRRARRTHADVGPRHDGVLGRWAHRGGRRGRGAAQSFMAFEPHGDSGTPWFELGLCSPGAALGQTAAGQHSAMGSGRRGLGSVGRISRSSWGASEPAQRAGQPAAREPGTEPEPRGALFAPRAPCSRGPSRWRARSPRCRAVSRRRRPRRGSRPNSCHRRTRTRGARRG